MSSKCWCPAPFNNVTVETDGTFSTCCFGGRAEDLKSGEPFRVETHSVKEVFDSQWFQQIRDNLSNGIKDPKCMFCWYSEDRGVESPRQIEIKKYEEYNFSSDKINHLDLALGNQCNLKCRSCSPRDSSLWIKDAWELTPETSSLEDYQKKYNFSDKSKTPFIEKIKKETLKDAKLLTFFGGEPFLMNSTWNIINESINQGYSVDQSLCINTNCTTWKNSELLEKFKKVEIRLSVDGVGQRFEYLRHPASWNNTLDIIGKILAWRDQSPDTRTVDLVHTVSIYNIWYIEEILDLCKTHDLDFFANPVLGDPDYLNVNIMPEELKCMVFSKINQLSADERIMSQLNKITKLDIGNNSELWPQFFTEVKKIDALRNESFEKTFPEWFNIIKEYM